MIEDKVLSEEELDEIVNIILGFSEVDDILDCVDICWKYGCNVITPPPGICIEDNDLNEEGFLNNTQLRLIYSHAIRSIKNQDDALEIFFLGYFDGISKTESLVAFLIALEFCDSEDNLKCLEGLLRQELYHYDMNLFSYREEIGALFEKEEELSKASSVNHPRR